MPSAAVDRALAAMRGRHALLVGDFMVDAYLYGETVRVSREAPVLVVRKQRLEQRLGGAANTAHNLTALGLRTTLVGAVGVDAAGVELCAQLQRTGAQVADLRRVARTTPVKTRILAGAFGTSRQQVLRLDDEPDGDLAVDDLQAMAASLRVAAEHVDVIIVSDYGAGTIAGPVLSTLLALARAGHRICVDSRYQLRRFVGVTAITPNVPEAEDTVGFHIGDGEAVLRAGSTMLADLQCDACLLTQGNLGMTLFRPACAPQHVDIIGHEEVTDVTGAGDTVIATLGAALAAGLGFSNAMALANCAAGVVVTKAGAAVAMPQEIVAAAAAERMELQTWERASA